MKAEGKYCYIGTYSDEYKLECEARYLYSLPAEQRLEELHHHMRVNRVEQLMEEMRNGLVRISS